MKLSLSILFAVLSLFSFGQSVTTTSSSGNWSSNGNWTGNSPENDDTAYVNHAMTINTDIEIDGGHYRINDAGTMVDASGGSSFLLTVKGSGEFDISGDATFENEAILQNNCTLWVRSCDTLTVGGMTLKNNSVLYVENCAVLIINGNLDLQNNNDSYVDGFIQVNGDVVGKNNATMTGSGSLSATGDVDINNSSTLFGSSSGCSSGCNYGSGPVLPVELASFTAEKDGRTVWLEWVTLSERNNDYFVLSRKIDNGTWEEISQYPGAGNSDRTITYGHRDYPTTGTQVYYRLRQVDFDGRYEDFFSNPVNFVESTDAVVVYPNPSTGRITVRHGVAMKPASMNLFGIDGQLVKSLDVNGLEQHLDLSAGIYMLRVEDQVGNTEVLPVVIQ